MTETHVPSAGQADQQEQSPGGARPGPALRQALSNNPMFTFVPWIIFWVVAGPRDWELATGCALLASVILLLLGMDVAPVVSRHVAGSASRRRVRLQTPKVLDIGTIAFFLAMVVVGFVVDRQALIALENYSQAISSGALALVVLLSIADGHPFTEQYARADAPPEAWHTPVFRRMMMVMSGTWAAIFVIMAVLGVVAESGVSGAGTSDVLNWYIPIALIVVGLKFNEWYPAHATRHVG